MSRYRWHGPGGWHPDGPGPWDNGGYGGPNGGYRGPGPWDHPGW